MSDEKGGNALLPALLAQSVQQAGEQAVDSQQELLQRLTGASARSGSGVDLSSQLDAMSQMATFKARVQSSGRVSIPDAEREALDIQEGDIVQTVIVPVKRNRDQDND